MYAEIIAAVQSTKTLAELLKAAHSLSNYSELLTAVTAVQQKLTEAIASGLESQEKQAALLERVRELEAQLAAVHEWQQQIERYALIEFPTKALAYGLKPEHANGEPHHHLCVTCVENKRKTTLQPQGRHLHCPICKTVISTAPQPPRQNNPRGGGSWMGY